MAPQVPEPLSAAEHAEVLGGLTRLMSRWSSLDYQRRITAGSGIDRDPATVRALYSLGVKGGTSRPSAIADELHLTRPSTSKLIARMAAAGLVERAADPSDRRSALVTLTVAGAATYDRLFGAGLDLVAAATTGWSADDVRQFSELLTRFVGGATSPHAPEPTKTTNTTRTTH